MNRNIIIIILSLSIFGTFAQNIAINKSALLFQDVNTKDPVIIIDDAFCFKGNSLIPKKFTATEYPDKLNRYTTFYIANRTFLVHEGCGPVLEYRNDSIVRIDNSFLHQNQIGAVKFTYKNEIYFWGGYGLFTFKNILTKYDFITREWNLIQTFSNEMPSPRRAAYSYCDGTDLFVFGGDEIDEGKFLQFKNCDNTVWKLHLETMLWNKIGNFNAILNCTKYNSFVSNNKLYLKNVLSDDIFYEIDFKNNVIKSYKSQIQLMPSQMFVDSKKNLFYCINTYSNLKVNYLKTPFKQLFGHPIRTEKFIFPETNHSSLVLIMLGFLTLALIYFYRKNLLQIVIPFNGIVYKKEEQTFFFKGKLLAIFENSEEKILIYLIDNRNHFVSLNELNKLFENNIPDENYATTLKRREMAFSSLISKLVLITGTSEKEFLYTQKNPDDKRIREVKIASDFFKIK